MFLTIDGEPRGKGRPRFTRSGHAYTPRETTEYEHKIRVEWLCQFGLTRINTGPVAVEIRAFYKIPAHASTADRERMMYGELVPCKKPDIDNVIKIVLDALNGTAYTDDTQVVMVRASKHYGTEPRVEIEVRELQLEDVRNG